MKCKYCNLPITNDNLFYGAGDGSGNNFAHEICYLEHEIKRLKKKIDFLLEIMCDECYIHYTSLEKKFLSEPEAPL